LAKGTSSWSFFVETGALSNGFHTFTVEATDSHTLVGAAWTTVTVNHPDASSHVPPSFGATSPVSGSTVSGTIVLTGTTNGDAPIARVETSIDAGPFQSAIGTDTWRFPIDTLQLPNGYHSIGMKATDAAGLSFVTSVGFNVSNSSTSPDTLPPTIEILSPTSGLTFAHTLTVRGTAGDTNAFHVDVSVDHGAPSAAVGTAQWSYSLDTTKFANGPHLITATATNRGGHSTSTVVTMTTANFNPPVVYTVPNAIQHDCVRPVDALINSWASSVPDYAVLQFAPGGCYGEDAEIGIYHRIGLTVDGNGSSFKDLTIGTPNRCNWRFEVDEGVTIENMVLYGANPTAGYNGSPSYNGKDYEWQHGISFGTVRYGTVRNVRIYREFGDFVEAQQAQTPPGSPDPSTGILVEGSYFEGNGRMGLGLTNVDGFVMRNSYVGDVNMAAVDVELDTDSAFGRNIQIINNTFGPMRFSLLSNGGAGYGANVGRITVSGNVEKGPLVSCDPPIYEHPNTPSMYRSDYTITNNQFLAFGDAMDFTQANNVNVSGNKIQFTNGQCDTYAGVSLVDSHTISVTNNMFHGAAVTVKSDRKSTGITDTGNSL
jgi:hypothetical protein